MEHWRPAGFDSENLGPLSNIPYLNAQIQLSRIIEDMMNTIHLPRPGSDIKSLDYQLDKLNLDLAGQMETELTSRYARSRLC